MKPTCLTMVDQQRSVLGSPGYPPYGWVEKRGTRQAYCGQVRDQLTGHYHLGNGHRTFSPFVMRFNSPDRLSPFGAGGINAYTYCNGDPINFYDPDGTDGVLTAMAAANYYIGYSGLTNAHKQGSNLMTIRMIGNRREQVIGMGRPDLAGEPISSAVVKGHQLSFAAHLFKASVGAVAEMSVNNAANDSAASRTQAILATVAALIVHVGVDLLDAWIPKPEVKYKKTLAKLDANIASLSQTASERTPLLGVVVHSLSGPVRAAVNAVRSTDTVDGSGHGGRDSGMPPGLHV